jgi:hypothetical protein
LPLLLSLLVLPPLSNLFAPGSAKPFTLQQLTEPGNYFLQKQPKTRVSSPPGPQNSRKLLKPNQIKLSKSLHSYPHHFSKIEVAQLFVFAISVALLVLRRHPRAKGEGPRILLEDAKTLT